jgi:DNA ligase-1
MDEKTILYSTTKLNKIIKWSTWVSGDTLYKQSGYVGGKTRDPVRRVCKAKNEGKANATTGKEQAILEMKSSINRQLDKGYILPDTLSLPQEKEVTFSPMLAQHWEKMGHKMEYPCRVQAKVDGIRCIASVVDEEVTLTSRLGKVILFKDHIRDEIKKMQKTWKKKYCNDDVFFDGELYTHDMPFSTVQSIVKRTKNIHPNDTDIQYWIFDLVCTTMPFSERWKRLKNVYTKNVDKNVIRLVPTLRCPREKLVRVQHDRWCAEGFEGIIIRNNNGMYRCRYRSSDLQKYKQFDDDEMKVVGFKEGQGTEEGCIVFQCKYKGNIFDCRPRGSFELRMNMLKYGKKYIGRTDYTVRYQGLSTKEVPRFPVGIGFRDGY